MLAVERRKCVVGLVCERRDERNNLERYRFGIEGFGRGRRGVWGGVISKLELGSLAVGFVRTFLSEPVGGQFYPARL